MSDWFRIRVQRVSITRYALYLMTVLAVLINLVDLIADLPGDYRLGLLSLPLVPALLYLARFRDRWNILPNIVVVALAFVYLNYSIWENPLRLEVLLLLVTAPMLFFFLTNLYLGSLLSVLSFLFFLIAWELQPQASPTGVAILVETSCIYLLVAVLAGLYECNWLQLEARLLFNSDIDFLTQIHNRRGLTRMLEKGMADALRHGQELAVILFEPDGYEDLVRRHGQHAADRVLVELTGLVARHVRAGDSLGRWDRHRFMLLAPNTGRDGAVAFAQKLRQLLNSYYFKGPGRLTASFGVVLLENDSMAELLEKLEAALSGAAAEGDRVNVGGA